MAKIVLRRVQGKSDEPLHRDPMDEVSGIKVFVCPLPELRLSKVCEEPNEPH